VLVPPDGLCLFFSSSVLVISSRVYGVIFAGDKGERSEAMLR
jgi:hypothetical protein